MSNRETLTGRDLIFMWIVRFVYTSLVWMCFRPYSPNATFRDVLKRKSTKDKSDIESRRRHLGSLETLDANKVGSSMLLSIGRFIKFG